MQYAYIRVSSADQNTARQEEALSKAGFQPDKICVEHASAKDTNRPGLQELLGQLRPGDTLLVHSIDRLCRNMSDMCAVTTRLRIYWNTVHLGHAVTERRNEGLDVPPEFLPHISPLGWAHILLTGEYLWPKEPKA